MQLERVLQQEIITRIELGKWPIIWVPVPNGIWIPARTATERSIAKRIIVQLKSAGMLRTGACDLVLLWNGGAACVECKRPATRTLFGKIPAGRSSAEQKEFAAECAAKGVVYVIVQSWDELVIYFQKWQILLNGRNGS
jgi:hypothetical protein